jgi:CDP-6-deoxy-D-xylo-4-hexulose-3-dehydrase
MIEPQISYAKTVYGQEEIDAIMKREVLLPLHHGMTDEMFDRFHKTIDEFVSKYL